MDEIKYVYLINDILNYLNSNNTDSKYYFKEVNNNGKTFGVITNERPLSDLTFGNLDNLCYGETYEEQNHAKKYLLNTNTICCYYKDGSRYWNCSPESIVNMNKLFYYFKCIDRDLLINVLNGMKEEDNSPKRTLFKK